ncbi:hypothetical protein T310_6775 [Rasamsonia emersonii CBS 393.64]|uniref:Vacuolar sorting protein Vps3844 C-terminal domain-containing protein n=1 Tax=Rasamsonia emersonii (strain ATCC 16479 / CBS 393.64 / IMI 116815) TaxID=1408163 RepID=A0A0F4YN40_RASE3|nr:hypothetical protein T310_6775 [Rasamsonia emersonii CBS 393.64]KKA19261.1 hypothetical protein T310_6775 [Rasamsonia emersonii CBS 393.64]
MPKLQQSKTTPSTLMPVCHASNSSCVTATNNCSGHGHCYLKYASKDEAIASDCYACKCEKTVIQNPDGTVKTVQWGGAACQKKDVLELESLELRDESHTQPLFLSGVSSISQYYPYDAKRLLR